MGKRWAAGFLTIVLGVIFGFVIVGPPGNDEPAPLLRADRGTEAPAVSTTEPATAATTTTEVTRTTQQASAATQTQQASGAPPYPGKPLKQGSSGADVRAWQMQMRKRGWDIAADGHFGQSAADACKAFQRQKGLDPSGEVDEPTWVASWTAPLPDETKSGVKGS